LWSRARPAADVLGYAVVILRSISELRHMWPLVQRRRAPSVTWPFPQGSSLQVSWRAPEIRRRPKCWRCTARSPQNLAIGQAITDGLEQVDPGHGPLKVQNWRTHLSHYNCPRWVGAVADTPFLQKDSFLPEEFFQPAISAAFGPRIRPCEHPRTGPDWPGRRAAQARWLPADRAPRGRGGAPSALFS
jgi:hypothetical protein